MNRNHFDCIRKSIIDDRGCTLDLQWVPDYAWDLNTFKDTVKHHIINGIIKWYNFENDVFNFEMSLLLNK